VAGKDRKKELARLRYERQQQRRAIRQARARRAKIIGTVVAVVVIAAGGVGVTWAMNRSDKPKSTPAAGITAKPPPSVKAKPGECAYQPLTAQAGQQVKDVGRPPVKPSAGTYQMTIDTGLGKIVAKLDGSKAACTVNSFRYLAGKNFFDNTKCHRLVTTGIKVLQCGDPSGTGTGGPAYGFGNENVPKASASGGQATYKRGVIAMAHSSAPNSNGSQFFIVYGNSPLPADYTVFGEITQGMDVVDSVAKAGAAPADQSGNTAPKKKIEIKDLTVAKM
jgi:peptidyl-prolyl cis-trans isomerase B (cyclophilin B)